MSSLSKLLRAAMTLALATAFGPRLAEAQKALVYCPVSIDATGCTAIKTALTSAYPGGIDNGYDGSQGTVDLKTVDLFQYAVVLVPSLAESDSAAPYAVLRDPAVASRLKLALLGRRAFWSGTPDQGVVATTRPQKDALIQNLAAWASQDFATVNGPGLVVLQDNSDTMGKRYDWVQAIAGFSLVADTKLASYGAVSSLTAAGNAVLSSGGSTLAYSNMASMGFQTPSGAPGTSLDAVGKTGTGVGGQVVLITQSGANTGGAVVTTDADDYAPGTPVVISGSGFGAGETVTLLLHEDPTIEPDFSFTTTADASGGFVFNGFTPDTLDVDVRFVLTATGQTSGKRAQTTFTDGQPQTLTLTPNTATVAPGGNTAYTVAVGMGGNANTCTVTLSVSFATPAPVGVTAAFSGGTNPFNASNNDFSRTLTLTTTNSGAPAGRTQPGSYGFTVTATRGANCQGNGNLTATGTLVVSGTQTTTLTLAAPSPASVSFGSTGSVSLSATLTSPSGAVSGAAVTFTVDGTAVNTTNTNSSGVATFATYNPSALQAAGHTVAATSAQLVVGGTTFLAATSGNQTLTVAPANQSITFGTITTKTFGDADFPLTATATSGLAVTYGAAGNCTVAGNSVTITAAGSCTITASQGGNPNFAAATPVQQTFAINKGSATLVLDVASLSATYDGAPHAATVTTSPAAITGVALTYTDVATSATSATAPTNAGKYTVLAKLTNTNYSATDATGTLVIARAAPLFSNVIADPITYKAATATISGSVKAGTIPATGSVGITVSGTGGSISGSATVNASGDFTTTVNTSALPANPTGYDIALLLPQSTNFEQATDNAHKLIVNKAAQSITFGPLAAKTFGDVPFAVSATSSSTLAVTFSASGDCTVSGSSVTITGAGNCTVTAEQTGDGNYDAAASVPQPFAIGQATANVSVNGYSGVYDGQPHGATGSATGVGGADLSGTLNLGQSFTNVPGGTASWTFTGGKNYKDAAGTAAITITPAPGSVSLTGPSTITYGQSSAISTTKVGDGSLSYAATAGGGTVCTVDATTGAVTMNSGTGDCTVTATLGVGTNYTGAVSTGLTIAAVKATATVNVSGGTYVYDGNPHGATGTATGLNNADLASLLNFGASFTDVPGGIANWSFTGDANYASASGTAQITITKANQATAVVLTAPGSMTFGQPAVTLTATGGDGTGAFTFSIGNSTGCSLAGNQLTVVNASASCDVTALRLGDNNHFDSPPTSASNVTLVKANATVAVTGFKGPYDGQAHGATGTATGVLNEDLSSGLSLGATFTNVPGGSADWTFAGGNNYNSTGGTAAITIDPRDASVTPAPKGKVYGQQDPQLTGSLSNFVPGDGITATYTRAVGNDVSGSPYLISAQLSPSGALGNYNITYGTADFTITPATPTVSVTGGSFTYDGNDHPATGAVAGVNGEVPGQPVFTYSRNGGSFGSAAPKAAGTWTVKANFPAGGNYTAAAEQTATISIAPKQISASITASGKTYDGTTAVTGTVGCALSDVVSADASSTACTASGAVFNDPNVGTRTVTANVALTGTTADNYTLAPATTASTSADISPASTTTVVSVSGATYDAAPHGGTALATGAGGLSQSVPVTYSGAGYGPSTTPPTAAGTYSASASFPVGGNYLGSTDAKPFTIAQRPITFTPQAADLTWTGSALTPVYSVAVTGGSFAGTEGLANFTAPSFQPATVTLVGTYPITVSGLTNINYAITRASGTGMVLDKSAPAASIISLNPVALNVAPSLTVNFTDVTTGNSNIVAWKLTLDGVDQGTFNLSGGPNATTTKQLTAYTKTDVVSVCVSGQDAGGNWSAPSCGLLAIFDPSAGFVTGGGWIDSPAGAYLADLSLKGKANFGFVSKYQKGANTPTGNTEFQFKEGNLNFSSTNFQWLVIQGTTMAQFKGTGTINGTGSYNFLVTAVDGDAFTGAKKPDSFRIKITNGSTVVYDNQMNADDTSASATVIGGGSIQIQSK